jgi:hypothetical protein
MTWHPIIPGDGGDSPHCRAHSRTPRNLRAGRWRALRQIERDLVELDPGLEALFFSFTQQAESRQRPRVEKVRSKPLRLLARLRWQPDRARATKTGVSGLG